MTGRDHKRSIYLNEEEATMLTWLRYHKGFKLGKEARNMIRDTYMEAQKEIENKKFERACLSGDEDIQG